MSFSFNTSLSGLNAQSSALNVIGNNIANSNTIGFRSGNITFMDVFENSFGVRLNGGGNTRQIGNGVQVAAVHTDFSQGNINESFSSLHAAIQGDGFFALKNTNGTAAYTRAGDFTVSNEGFLVTPNGSRVQGYMAIDGTIAQDAVLTSVQIPIGETLAPKVTAEGTFRMNLNADALPGATFHATMQVYDTRGSSHTLDMVFERQADGTYLMSPSVDGNAAEADVDGAGPAAGPFTFDFDTDGNLISPTSLAIVPDQSQLDGATMPQIDINLRETNADGSPGAFNITSFALPSTVSSTLQDGYPAGELSSAVVDASGTIFGIFSNGQSRVVGQYAIARFNSNAGLQRVGGNMFAETLASGQATIGAPGTGGRGAIAGGYLEQSNVNITNEFVDLIEAQRGFQANSRVITGLNQTFQEILNII
ncbi:MAG: flagellar hook protein FlgE [Pyrinomonadaceae bacterium]